MEGFLKAYIYARGLLPSLTYQFITMDLAEEPKCKDEYGLPSNEAIALGVYHHSQIKPSMEIESRKT